MNDETLKKIKFLERNKSFLGREFLTWLWDRIQAEEHKFRSLAFGDYLLYIDDLMVLGSRQGAVHHHQLKGGTPAYAQETRQAVENGKFVEEAKFIVEYQQKLYHFTLQENLDLKNVKLPITSTEFFLADRLIGTQFLYDLTQELFEEFMNVRKRLLENSTAEA